MIIIFIVHCLIREEKWLKNREERADLNGNMVDEVYTLAKAKLIVVEGEKIIWQSPETWQVDNFVLADVNNDGVIDLNLSLWKEGSFGASKPFWIKENDLSTKNHFFIYDLVGDEVKMIWGSSNLGVPNCEFAIADMDNNGQNELLVIEGEYKNNTFCDGEYVALWQWNGWGFTNNWRSPRGRYINLRVVEENKNKRLEVDSDQGILSFFPFAEETP